MSAHFSYLQSNNPAGGCLLLLPGHGSSVGPHLMSSLHSSLELATNLREDFTITEKAHLGFRILLRHYAKQAPKHGKLTCSVLNHTIEQPTQQAEQQTNLTLHAT